MKIQIKRVGGAPISLDEFAAQHNLTMDVIERNLADWQFVGARYYAEFHGAEIKDGSCLVGATGNANTPEEAIADYVNQIRGCLLVFNPGDPNRRREIQCPNEWADPAGRELAK